LFCFFDRVTPILTSSTFPSDKILTYGPIDSGGPPSKALSGLYLATNP